VSNVSGTVGVIANPAAGKDIRRLIAHASPTSDAAKMGVVRRAIVGAIDGGATRILVAPDRHNLSTRAVADFDYPSARIEIIDEPTIGHPSDTISMATHMKNEDVDALIVLGGDGTHRDVAKGWLNAPIVGISTGTNNVFPRQIDATLAGLAAGLVASRVVALSDVTFQAKVAHVMFDDGTHDDLALVDIVLMHGNFTGSRAVWEPAQLMAVVACIAEPASVGLSAIAALLKPVDRRSPGGVHVALGGPNTVRVPIAPGAFADVRYWSADEIDLGQSVTLCGPGVLSFDGERDRVLGPNIVATVRILADGPRVIDVDATLAAAVAAKHFQSGR
jgi:predicted polyphosphate/ATP-dependent NAD kinase